MTYNKREIIMNQKETIKYINSCLKPHNLILDKHDRLKINGSTAYFIKKRYSYNDWIIKNMTLSSALNKVLMNDF
jgi:hypothetical protein